MKYLYFISTFCWLASSSQAYNCNMEYDTAICVFNVKCPGIYDLPFYYYESTQPCTIWIPYDGRNYAPVKLTITNGPRDLDFSSSYGRNIVYSLDMSHNMYQNYPELAEMPYLEKMNMSNNALGEARLYNEYYLKSLLQLDYSHNEISKIDDHIIGHSFINLTWLSLSYNQIETIPDSTFTSVKNLRVLDLSHNLISDLHLQSFEGLHKLTTLNISHNKISEINLNLIHLSNLQELDLSNNILTYINAESLQFLSNLVKIDIGFNQISKVSVKIFSNCRNLSIINFKDNQLESIPENLFENLTHLQEVDFSINKIIQIPMYLFRGNQISKFSIEDNILSGLLLKGIFDGLNLAYFNISHQQVTSVDDLAFVDMKILNTLLLNNNKITHVSKNAFKTLKSLIHLDLSYNMLTNAEFEKEDLTNLLRLHINNNKINYINSECFSELAKLEVLDLSYNEITQIEDNTFNNLNHLLDLEISHNPINHKISKDTFTGINSLFSFDISYTGVTELGNYSFQDINSLRNLRISHNKLHEIEFNAFTDTNLDTVDLSFNYLTQFNINTTDLEKLKYLYLNNNNLKSISSTLRNLQYLLSLSLSFNNITNSVDDIFDNMKSLEFLDLSFNPNYETRNLLFKDSINRLYIASVNNKNVSFKNLNSSSLTILDMSNSSIININEIKLEQLKTIINITLSHNKIFKVEVGAFSRLSNLQQLDLSCNKIQFIQPGTFRDTSNLQLLNISHNVLTTINYGVFRGLVNLNTLDMSHNFIENLENERFYQVSKLHILIVDHNNISTFDVNDFNGTQLAKLSIGHNPLSCNLLVNIRKKTTYVVTAVSLDESTINNVEGITCNFNGFHNKVAPNNDIITIPQKHETQFNFNATYFVVEFLNNITKENVDVNKKILNNLNDVNVKASTLVIIIAVCTCLMLCVFIVSVAFRIYQRSAVYSHDNVMYKMADNILDDTMI